MFVEKQKNGLMPKASRSFGGPRVGGPTSPVGMKEKAPHFICFQKGQLNCLFRKPIDQLRSIEKKPHIFCFQKG
jgi:hypothetical protein